VKLVEEEEEEEEVVCLFVMFVGEEEGIVMVEFER
jgi:hypothetical protein